MYFLAFSVNQKSIYQCQKRWQIEIKLVFFKEEGRREIELFSPFLSNFLYPSVHLVVGFQDWLSKNNVLWGNFYVLGAILENKAGVTFDVFQAC